MTSHPICLEVVEPENRTAAPEFLEKRRVRLNKPEHPQNLQAGVIVRTLPNPSMKAEHQWYDVRFDSGSLGRFLKHFLEPLHE